MHDVILENLVQIIFRIKFIIFMVKILNEFLYFVRLNFGFLNDLYQKVSMALRY